MYTKKRRLYSIYYTECYLNQRVFIGLSIDGDGCMPAAMPQRLHRTRASHAIASLHQYLRLPVASMRRSRAHQRPMTMHNARENRMPARGVGNASTHCLPAGWAMQACIACPQGGQCNHALAARRVGNASMHCGSKTCSYKSQKVGGLRIRTGDPPILGPIILPHNHWPA